MWQVPGYHRPGYTEMNHETDYNKLVNKQLSIISWDMMFDICVNYSVNTKISVIVNFNGRNK